MDIYVGEVNALASWKVEVMSPIEGIIFFSQRHCSCVLYNVMYIYLVVQLVHYIKLKIHCLLCMSIQNPEFE